MLDGTILTGRVHCLENKQNGISVEGIEQLLQRTQARDMFTQQLLVVFP
jgi:hypothetical protein